MKNLLLALGLSIILASNCFAKESPEKEEVTMCNNLLKGQYVDYSLLTAIVKGNILTCQASVFQGYEASVILYQVNLDTMAYYITTL